jgi:tetratricopeptide (TPR) repeat protein
MFFPRLRRRAKWIFLLLAVVFMLGFVGFGVGSGAGSGGIGNFISDFIHGGSSSSGPSVEDAQKKLAKNPKDAAARLELANALTNQGNLTGAVTALEAYTKVRPKDTEALQQLAGLWARIAERKRQVAINAYFGAQAADPGQTFFSGTFSQAIGQDPLTQQLTQQASQSESQATLALQNAYRKEEDVYKRLAALLPKDPTTQLQLGQAAQLSQDTATAVRAYQTFLRLAPDDPSAPQVKKILKSLHAAPSPQTSG